MLMQRICGFNSFSRRVVPTKVPLVPRPATKCVICPRVCSQISGAVVGVVRRGIRRIAVLIGIEIFLGIGVVNFAHAPDRAVGGFVARRVDNLDAVCQQNLLPFGRRARRAGKALRGSRAPRRSWRRRFPCCRWSRRGSLCPGRRSPRRSPSRIMEYAARSFTEPPGIEPLRLGANLDVREFRAGALETDQRRIADAIEQVLAHWGGCGFVRRYRRFVRRRHSCRPVLGEPL